jgi:hypothetical protein
MPISKIVAPVAIIVLLFLTLISTTDNDIMAFEEHLNFMNGVSFVAPPKPFEGAVFEDVIEINANWVAIMPYAFANGNVPEILFDQEGQWWGERTEGVLETIRRAKEKELKILLKPHVWVRGQGWTGDFMLQNESDWKAWERNYEEYILHFARLADSLDIEAFCIGLEYKNAVKERHEFWRELITKTRKHYRGKITYAANWDNYQNVPFWDQLDFIGLNAYFPLSQESTPNLSTLKSAWAEKKILLSAFSKKYKKKIVFTEYGYRSIDKGAGNQWELESHREYQGESNLEIQSRAYIALFESVWHEPWFGGGFLWKWYSQMPFEMNVTDTDYTPQNKPTVQVISNWYKKR